MAQTNEVAKGLVTGLYINDQLVAGGTSTLFSQSSSPIDITNLIKYDWAEFLSGLKTWEVSEAGVYILNTESLYLIQEKFLSGEVVVVKLEIGNQKFIGNAIVTDFPIGATYNNSYKYSITLRGTGPLQYE